MEHHGWFALFLHGDVAFITILFRDTQQIDFNQLSYPNASPFLFGFVADDDYIHENITFKTIISLYF